MRTRRIYWIAPLLAAIIVSTDSYPQETSRYRQKMGFDYGQSSGWILKKEYDYQVKLYQLHYYHLLKSGSNWTFEWLTQAQVNSSRFKRAALSTEYSSGYECGLNLGLLLRTYLGSSRLSAYLLGSIGPHYISAAPAHQARGFIFSDNVFMGLEYRIGHNTFLNARGGYRHISNAGLKNPNLGVDNVLFGVGIIWGL